jgi:hypothetical protein
LNIEGFFACQAEFSLASSQSFLIKGREETSKRQYRKGRFSTPDYRRSNNKNCYSSSEWYSASREVSNGKFSTQDYFRSNDNIAKAGSRLRITVARTITLQKESSRLKITFARTIKVLFFERNVLMESRSKWTSSRDK